MLPTNAKARKNIPLYSGLIKYFPRALAAVAELSRIGNDQHNPGKPLHWDRSKSGDELDALCRHLFDEAMGTEVDADDVLHATKRSWRSLADLEKKLEARERDAVANMAAEVTVRSLAPPTLPTTLYKGPTVDAARNCATCRYIRGASQVCVDCLGDAEIGNPYPMWETHQSLSGT